MSDSPAATRHAVLIVDDEEASCRGLARVLRRRFDCHTATSGSTALQLLDRHAVDVIVSDHAMPGGSGVELLERVAVVHPTIGRVLMTGFATVDVAMSAINSGRIVRMLRKPFRIPDLEEAIEDAIIWRGMASAAEDVAKLVQRYGNSPIDPGLRRTDWLRDNLSPREHEVFELVAAGWANDEIARQLYVSPHTVRNHVKSIFEKLEVHSRVELISRYGRMSA